MGRRSAAPSCGGQIYTLAQTGTTSQFISRPKPGIILNGKGSDLSNRTAIRNRTKRKQISQVLSIGLAEIARIKGDLKLEKTFWNSYHCLDTIKVAEGRIYGKYCKNRMCLVCLSIRKAEIINKYLPVIDNWDNPYFVTLTVKAVPARKLKAVIDSMLIGFHKILNKYKKRNQRGKGIRLVGIKSLESNYNSIKRTYNPHFHLLVPDAQTAQILVDEWLKTSRKTWTTRAAQDIRKVHNNEKCLIEIVKYGSKIFSEPDIAKKSQKGATRTIYLMALYTIVEAMKGKRLFERFGFNLPEKREEFSQSATFYEEFREYEFELRKPDWVDTSTAQPLSDYVVDPKVCFLLENCIDKTLY